MTLFKVVTPSLLGIGGGNSLDLLKENLCSNNSVSSLAWVLVLAYISSWCVSSMALAILSLNKMILSILDLSPSFMIDMYGIV